MLIVLFKIQNNVYLDRNSSRCLWLDEEQCWWQGGKVEEEGGEWAKSVFKVGDELIKHGVPSSY